MIYLLWTEIFAGHVDLMFHFPVHNLRKSKSLPCANILNIAEETNNLFLVIDGVNFTWLMALSKVHPTANILYGLISILTDFGN